jgi:TRAP-type C4-dicarboxylate transport system substrate-binding protein
MGKTLLAGALAAATALTPLAATAESLIFGTGNVPMHPLNKRIMEPWVEEVNTAAGGALEISARHGPALVSPQNYVDRVTDDVVQLAWGMLVFDPGRFPRSLVATMPFIEGSAEAGAIAFCSLYEEGAFGEEFADYHPLFFVPFPQTRIHLNGSELTSYSDLEGKKVVVGSPVGSAIVSANGGTPLSIILPDQYQALQRGTAEGTIINYTAFPAFNLHEVTTDHLDAPLGGAIGMVFMLKERFEALPDEAKAVLDAHSGCDTTRQMGAKVDQWEADAKGFVQSQDGHTFNEPSADETAALKARVFDGIVAGFAERVPGGAELVQQWEAAMAAAREEVGGGS